MISLGSYDYSLPKELIANTPASPRDSSRLFIYDTASDTVMFDRFWNLHKHLPENAHLIFNDTKVVPARLWLRKETGGKIQVLLLMNELHPQDTEVKGIVDRKLEVGAKLFFDRVAHLEVVRQEEQFFFFRPSIPMSELFHLLVIEGHTPVPPYIKGGAMKETGLRKKYQSIFAKHPASVAAPTASLHFTPRVMGRLDARKDIRTSFLTLHVGMGTFAPVNEEDLRTRTLHREFCLIGKRTAGAIDRSLDAGRPVIPVGTTALRTLECFAYPYRDKYHVLAGAKGTNIFIFPPYEFKIASGLITNFHVPNSSLMLLVDALLEHKRSKRRILDLYKVAIEERFRFFSFGDAMLIK